MVSVGFWWYLVVNLVGGPGHTFICSFGVYGGISLARPHPIQIQWGWGGSVAGGTVFLEKVAPGPAGAPPLSREMEPLPRKMGRWETE